MSFSGGVYVAVGDVDGDGKADIITGPGAGGGPHVKIFFGSSGSVVDQFMAYGAGFTGGVRVAAGDVNGDGVAEVITGAGVGGGPHVEVFSESQSSNNYYYNYYQPAIFFPATMQHTRILSTMAFDATYTGGVFVAAGDVNGDGKAELIVSQG